MTGWTETTLRGGRWVAVTDLLQAGTHTLEIHGNTDEGWAVYLHDQDDTCVELSPVFHREYGDTRADLYRAAERTYGRRPKHTQHYL